MDKELREILKSICIVLMDNINAYEDGNIRGIPTRCSRCDGQNNCKDLEKIVKVASDEF